MPLPPCWSLLPFDSRLQRSQLQVLHVSHKTNVSRTHGYRTTAANTRFLQTGQPHVILYSNSHLSDDLYQYTTDSRLSYDRRKYKILQKRPGLSEEAVRKCLLASLSNPIQSRKKSLYTRGHPKKLPPNGGDESSSIVSPSRFRSLADQFPDLVSRLHVQVRLMSNFGLNGSRILMLPFVLFVKRILKL